MMEELWRLLRCKGVNGPHHQLQIVFHLWIPNDCLKNTPNSIKLDLRDHNEAEYLAIFES